MLSRILYTVFLRTTFWQQSFFFCLMSFYEGLVFGQLLCFIKVWSIFDVFLYVDNFTYSIVRHKIGPLHPFRLTFNYTYHFRRRPLFYVWKKNPKIFLTFKIKNSNSLTTVTNRVNDCNLSFSPITNETI